MCKLFNIHEKEIKAFCVKNSLDFDKIKKMPQCWGKNDVWVQYHDPGKGSKGLNDETPAPIVLKINIKNGKAICEKTEHTDALLKLLS